MAVPRLADLDEPVDLAPVQVRADRVLDVVQEGIAAGVRPISSGSEAVLGLR